MTLYGLWRSSSRMTGRREEHLSTLLPLSAIFSKLSSRRGRSAAFPRRFGLRPISSSSIIFDAHAAESWFCSLTCFTSSACFIQNTVRMKQAEDVKQVSEQNQDSAA